MEPDLLFKGTDLRNRIRTTRIRNNALERRLRIKGQIFSTSAFYQGYSDWKFSSKKGHLPDHLFAQLCGSGND